jgi:uncharacterized membrane protein
MNNFIKDRLWLFFSVLAALFWGVWGVLTKLISSDINPFTTHFMFTVGMILTLPFVIYRCRGKRVNIKGLILGIGMGIPAVIGNVLVYKSFEMGGQAAVVIPLTNLYPVITIVIAFLVFREKLHWINGIGIIIVLPAIIMLSDQSQIFNNPSVFIKNLGLKAWLLYAFLAFILYGLFSASQKVTTRFLSPEWSYLSFIVSSVLLTVCFLISDSVDFSFSKQTFFLGTMAGLLDGLGVLAIYSAYQANGKAAQVSSIAGAMQQVFTVAMSFVFLNERLSFIGFSGIALAVIGSILLSLKKKETAE